VVKEGLCFLASRLASPGSVVIPFKVKLPKVDSINRGFGHSALFFFGAAKGVVLTDGEPFGYSEEGTPSSRNVGFDNRYPIRGHKRQV
jgi:hypothetical protein